MPCDRRPASGRRTSRRFNNQHKESLMRARNALTVLSCMAVVVAATAAGSLSAPESAPPVGIDTLRYVTLAVKDQDEALRWYVDKLGFVKTEDQKLPSGERWLVIAPSGQTSVGIVLLTSGGKHIDDRAFKRRIGGETLWVFTTPDAKSTCDKLLASGVNFTQQLEVRPWGAQAIIEDLYGNQFVVTQPR